AEPEEPVVDVPLVGQERELQPREPARPVVARLGLPRAPERAPQERRAGVEDREAEDQDRDRDRDRRRPLLRALDREHAEQEPEEEAARVAEEDRRRVEIEPEEAERRAEEDRVRDRDLLVAEDERDRERARGRDQRDARGEPVDAVDQV